MSEQRGSPLSGAAEQAGPTVGAKGPKTAAFALEDLKRLLRLPVSFLDRLRTLILGFKQATTLQAEPRPHLFPCHAAACHTAWLCRRPKRCTFAHRSPTAALGAAAD